MFPDGAILEAKLTDQVALYDVSHLLPVGIGDYKFRPPEKVDRLFVHKSGADGADGFEGLYNCARFCVAEWGRGWPGCAYHFWDSRKPDYDPVGRMVIYRAQPDHARTYHSGGAANWRGASLAFQGAFDGQWDLLAHGRPRVEVEPTEEQMICAEAFLPWALQHYGLVIEDVVGHWEAGAHGGKSKAICPGDFLRMWIMEKRGELEPLESPQLPPEAPGQPGELRVRPIAIKDLQRALALLDHDPGQIDGIWGHRSRKALERFQYVHSLEVDGWYGPATAAKLLEVLRRRGLSTNQFFENRQ